MLSKANLTYYCLTNSAWIFVSLISSFSEAEITPFIDKISNLERSTLPAVLASSNQTALLSLNEQILMKNSGSRHQHIHKYSEEISTQDTIDDLLSSLMTNGYDNRFRPNFKGTPVEVECSVHINIVTAFSEANLDFTVDFYLLQLWDDYRLSWNAPSDHKANIADESTHLVWQPDTYITNAKAGSFHDVTKANSYLEISPHGHVQQSSRMTLVAACNMDFHEFPFDSQTCLLGFESYSYPITDVSYRWLRNSHNPATTSASGEYQHAASFSEGYSMAHYLLTGFRVDETSALRHDGLNYSRLSMELFFSRKVGYYLIQFYLPSGILVVSSWIAFWIPRNSSPARVTLSVTVNLAMVTLSCQEKNLPKVSYVKALDIYLLACFTMVFLSLIEFAIVSYTTETLRKQRRRAVHFYADLLHFSKCNHHTYNAAIHQYLEAIDSEQDCDDCNNHNKNHSNYKYDFSSKALESDKQLPFMNYYMTTSYAQKRIPGKIEAVSRTLFPISFIVFNCIYWSYYYYLNDDYSSTAMTGFIKF